MQGGPGHEDKALENEKPKGGGPRTPCRLHHGAVNQKVRVRKVTN